MRPVSPRSERQDLVLDPNTDPSLASTGLRFISIEHEGCFQKSAPEAYRVHQLYQNLLGQRWTDRAGQVYQIGVDDILVVSPHNMQVNLLRSCLPERARVGTVDKFQGQEAARHCGVAEASGDRALDDRATAVGQCALLGQELRGWICLVRPVCSA
jgi:hypothetical protein